MPYERIEIQFAQLQALADELAAAGEGLLKISGKGLSAGGIKAGWSSENAEKLLEKEELLMRKASAAGENIRALSEEIRTRTKILYDVEKWNSFLAKERSC